MTKPRFLPLLAIAPLGPVDDLFDQAEVEQRLTALELDLDRRGRRAEGHVEATLGRFERHVIALLVAALARDLAVGTGVLAAQ